MEATARITHGEPMAHTKEVGGHPLVLLQQPPVKGWVMATIRKLGLLGQTGEVLPALGMAPTTVALVCATRVTGTGE